jgi:hypothetical protein
MFGESSKRRLFMKLLALWKFNLIPNPSAQAALSLQEKGT